MTGWNNTNGVRLMRCPTLAQLPPPHQGKAGWPWTEETPQLPDSMPDGSPWPRISIVTPSYNQGRFIEETIRSELLQGYPNLEYIIIDGGSTDESLEIIKAYAPWLAYWVSEPDKGQSHAINKGITRAGGDILGWLNSDDTYEACVLKEVAESFSMHPEADVISGRCNLWYGDRRDRLMPASPLRTFEDFLRVGSNWLQERLIIQPEAFFRSRAIRQTRGLREDLHYGMDACLWMDMVKAGCNFQSVDRHWANIRIHAHQKTAALSVAYAEVVEVAWEHLRENWTELEDPRGVADDIFKGALGLLKSEQASLRAIRHSTTYRLAAFLARLKPVLIKLSRVLNGWLFW
jgi:glycosyltransferase involved in cell wall biosynthesis